MSSRKFLFAEDVHSTKHILNFNLSSWNGVHHRTTLKGAFGFPDPTWEDRVGLELDAKGMLNDLRSMLE